MDNYPELFQTAKERTKKLNLLLPCFNEEKGFLLTKTVVDEIPLFLHNNFGRLSTDELVGQCLHIHRELSDPFSLYFRRKVVFTIGYVKTNKEALFYFDESEIVKHLANKINPGQPLNIHAWLTLPTMEIIDFSIVTTISIKYEDPSSAGGIIAKHPKDLKDGLEYIPMLIGDDYLWKIGAIFPK